MYVDDEYLDVLKRAVDNGATLDEAISQAKDIVFKTNVINWAMQGISGQRGVTNHISSAKPIDDIEHNKIYVEILDTRNQMWYLRLMKEDKLKDDD